MKKSIKQFIHDERGVSTVSYAILAGMLTVGLMVAVAGVVAGVSLFFNRLAENKIECNADYFP